MPTTRLWTLLLGLALAAVWVWPAAAQGGGRDDAFEQAIYNRLVAISPEAAESFKAATVALDAGQLEAARAGYEKTLALVPGFADAERRLSYVERNLKNYKDALVHAQNAYQADPSAFNQAALAEALVNNGDQAAASQALDYARSAVKAFPDDAYINYVLIRAGAEANDTTAVRQGSTKLVALFPEEPTGHFYLGLAMATDQQWEDAEREILLAQKLGLPADVVQKTLKETGISQQAGLSRWGRYGAASLIIWGSGLGILLAVGVILSQATVAAVRRPVSNAQYTVGWGERLMRQIYRGIIGVTSLYFYLSMPFVILVVVGVAGGIIYLFFAIGRIPLQLLAFVVVSGLYTLIAIGRSLFIRLQEREPGRPLMRAEAPRLWAVAEAVAQKLQTRVIDVVYLTPGVEIAVTERGGLVRRLRGAGQRCLILGLGALPGMSQGQFESILAHEYGHFSNRDTAGGGLARQVGNSIQMMAYGLAANGLARWYNPAWLFVSGFSRIFFRITLGASRLQEALADRYAVIAYGARNFVDGLTHMVRQSLIFDLQVTQAVNQAFKPEGSQGLNNLYTLPDPAAGDQQKDLNQKYDEALAHPTSPYDSHPSVRERIQFAQQIGTASGWESPDRAWDLLANVADLQAEMTKVVEDNVRRQLSRQSNLREGPLPLTPGKIHSVEKHLECNG